MSNLHVYHFQLIRNLSNLFIDYITVNNWEFNIFL